MRTILCAALAAFAALQLATTAAAGELEDGVLNEINFARAEPRRYAELLFREARTEGAYLNWVEYDPDALNEAVAFLRRQPPLPPLTHDGRLAAAASDHAQSQGRRGQIGHEGPGGETPGQRLQRHGVWAGMSAENISYGFSTPREVVAQLIIDSGVASRGHRRNIFGAGWKIAGVACGAHRVYGSMCVIDFAGALVAR